MAAAGAPGAHWQLVLEKVDQRCGYLLTSGLWADCSFVVGSETNQVVVPAHKLILAMASPVFEAMFYGELKERNEFDIPIVDVQPEAFRALLQYIYTGEVTIVSFDMAWDLWYGAKKYMLPHLVDECHKYISSVLDPKNACKAYEFAHLFDEKPLVDTCLKIICANTKRVLNNISFDDVDLNTVITVFSLEHLNIDSELDLFNALARYAKAEQRTQGQISSLDDSGAPSKNLEVSTSDDKVLLSVESSVQMSPPAEIDSNSEVATSETTLHTADKEKIKKEKPTIHTALEKIRFLSLNAQQFGEGPASSGLLTKAESFAIFMNIVSTASSEPMPTGFSECRERRKPLGNLVRAVCSYSAQEGDELSFEKDDIIETDGSVYGSWWKGELRGKSGYIPKSCVTKLC